jgi:hypothetical protein
VASATFSEDAFQLSWQLQHFGDLHPHFAWRAQRFRRVMLRVFLRIALSELRQVGTGFKLRGGRGIF